MTVPFLQEPDESLAARATAGDGDAFEEIVSRYWERAFRLALRLAGSEADAQDVVQDAFLQAYRHLSQFRGDSRFGTWLYRIVTNAALMQRRTRARRPAESLETYLPRFDDSGRHCET